MLSTQTIDVIKSTVPVLAVHGTDITKVFYKNLFSAHPELLNIFNHANQSQGRQQTALANTVYAAALHIDQLEALLPAVKQIAHKHRSLGVKEEHYPIVGEHLLGAIKEVLGDAATPEILSAWEQAYGVIASVFISVEKEMYTKAAEQPAGWDGFKDFKVVRKVRESSVITSFYLEAADGSTLPPFQPGQYITVRVSIPGKEYTANRQYSLSAAPNENYYRISVKKEADREPFGTVSTYLHDHVQAGDTIEISAPAGDFVLDTEAMSPVTFISGGVGITPFMSMLGYIANHQPSRPVSFLHGTRNKQTQAFDLEIKDHMRNIHDTTNCTLFSDEPNGYITPEFIEENMLKNSDIYLCGPVPFLEIMTKHLAQLGVEEEKIHLEFFGPAVSLSTN
ncbi:NO-inducible flavohemoprotein [Paenisporosarcina cavernae]|uniref:Flavohemoprotein n=1 Tax=Paenisporosarcina cavernae TaxID=2320858 RepID=A0A385YZ42_9BACL|nr:NO-inducible flavohemoprotein [Paenisporosarcina cavernae]AYC30843.1 NO-inducible flavohemoprotein [Paenisporosarcina cavernae]